MGTRAQQRNSPPAIEAKRRQIENSADQNATVSGSASAQVLSRRRPLPADAEIIPTSFTTAEREKNRLEVDTAPYLSFRFAQGRCKAQKLEALIKGKANT